MTEVEIEYCVPCGLRDNALETAGSILAEFGRDLDGVKLIPGHGGVFKVYVNDEVVFDKDEQGYDINAIINVVAERSSST